MRTTAREFAALSASRVTGDAVITGVTFDSRKVSSGMLFVAVRGNRVDGHDFVPSAVSNGASAVLINADEKERILPFMKGRCAIIVAEDTLSALRRFVSIRCSSMDAHLIGITGSCGKTTTKEMLHAILSVSSKAVKTPGNLNSEYGLPLSLLNLDDESEYGVFEIGVDHIGEMEAQAAMLSPEYSVITNIGISHLEAFGSRDRIALEKSGIILPHSEAFALSDCDFNGLFASKARCFHSVTSPFTSVENLGLEGFRLSLGSGSFLMPCVGEHNLKDASLAISVARRLGVSDKDIMTGLSSIQPVFGRSRIVKEGSVTVIEDCYNATLDSVSDAIATVDHISWHGSKHIVLGDMRELGSESRKAHEEIGHRLSKCSCDRIFLYGEEIENTYRVLRSEGLKDKVLYTRDFNELSDRVSSSASAGDLMLLKGSRVMAMERIYDALRKVV